MVTSHLGRPEGRRVRRGGLARAGRAAPLGAAGQAGAARARLARRRRRVEPGDVVLLENCRFNKGEKKDDEALAKKMAALCDVYVIDAFGTAHRAEATTHGIAKFAKVACAGPLLAAELDALERALEKPARPLVAIVAGSKVSTKLTILECARRQGRPADRRRRHRQHVPARGRRSHRQVAAEPELVSEAQKIIDGLEARGGSVPLPTDVVCAQGSSRRRAQPTSKRSTDVAGDDMILDIGPDTAKRFAAIARQGRHDRLERPGRRVRVRPVRRRHQDDRAGDRRLAAFSIAGGGDTLAAIEKYGVADGISYISTGGGAFLEFLEGKKLPARSDSAAKQRARRMMTSTRQQPRSSRRSGPLRATRKRSKRMIEPGSTWCA